MKVLRKIRKTKRAEASRLDPIELTISKIRKRRGLSSRVGAFPHRFRQRKQLSHVEPVTAATEAVVGQAVPLYPHVDDLACHVESGGLVYPFRSFGGSGVQRCLVQSFTASAAQLLDGPYGSACLASGLADIPCPGHLAVAVWVEASAVDDLVVGWCEQPPCLGDDAADGTVGLTALRTGGETADAVDERADQLRCPRLPDSDVGPDRLQHAADLVHQITPCERVCGLRERASTASPVVWFGFAVGVLVDLVVVDAEVVEVVGECFAVLFA